MDDRRLSPPAEERPQETAGQSFVKKIRPNGCAVFLIAFVLLLVYCLVPPDYTVAGYTPPHDSTYYAQSDATLLELKAELETHLLPQLDGAATCALGDGVLIVTTGTQELASIRGAILTYYDKSLFQFTTQ